MKDYNYNNYYNPQYYAPTYKKKLKNPKNRWEFTTTKENGRYYSSLLLVSTVVLCSFLLLQGFSAVIVIFFRNSISMLYDAMGDGSLGTFANDKLYLINDILMSLGSIVTFSPACVFMFLLYRSGAEPNDPEKVTFKNKLPENPFRYIIVTFGAFYFANYIFGIIHSILNQNGITERVYQEPVIPDNIAQVLFHIFAIAVVPAIMEEITFRYFALNILKKYGNTFAIITTSIFFGFIHASPNAFFFATAFGILSAYITIKTKSIRFSMIMHFFVNLVSVAFELMSKHLAEESVQLVFVSFQTIIFLFSLIFIIIAIRKHRSIKLSEYSRKVYVSIKAKILWFFNPVTVLFLILVIASAISIYLPDAYGM